MAQMTPHGKIIADSLDKVQKQMELLTKEQQFMSDYQLMLELSTLSDLIAKLQTTIYKLPELGWSYYSSGGTGIDPITLKSTEE
jgi:hypothetical protein